MDMFLWMMPMPPSWAIVMARRASVTVSMAADSTGNPSLMLRVRVVERSTSRGSTVECAGTRRTSSNVRASSRIRMAHSTHLPGSGKLGHVPDPGTHRLHRRPAEPGSAPAAGTGPCRNLGGSGAVQFHPTGLRALVFHPEGQGSADPRGHVSPAQYVLGVHPEIRAAGAGAWAGQPVRAPRRLPADRRAHGGSRRWCAEARI